MKIGSTAVIKAASGPGPAAIPAPIAAKVAAPSFGGPDQFTATPREAPAQGGVADRLAKMKSAVKDMQPASRRAYFEKRIAAAKDANPDKPIGKMTLNTLEADIARTVANPHAPNTPQEQEDDRAREAAQKKAYDKWMADPLRPSLEKMQGDYAASESAAVKALARKSGG